MLWILLWRSIGYSEPKDDIFLLVATMIEFGCVIWIKKLSNSLHILDYFSSYHVHDIIAVGKDNSNLLLQILGTSKNLKEKHVS